MGPAQYKMFRALSATFPRSVDLLNTDKRRKLHLGAGADVDPGWVNIDQSYANRVPGDETQLQLNVLRVGEWFPPGSADLILSHHLVEHIHYKAALAGICQWAELLAPGGCMYVCVPDIAWGVDCARRGKHWELQPEYRRGRFDVKERTWERINALIYQGGDHRSAWCPDALLAALRGAGLEPRLWERPELVDSDHWLPCCEVIAVGRKPQ